jgi:hypothetical protein
MTYQCCKLCQKPIFRNKVEVSKRYGKGYSFKGIFHKYCGNKYIKKVVNK